MALQDNIIRSFLTDTNLQVLFVFDPTGEKLMELEHASWPDNIIFEIFNGEWFNYKVKADHEWADRKVVLLFPYQLSPVGNRELESKFYLMDLLCANKEFHEQDYLSFMQERGLPKSMAPFVSRHIQELQTSACTKMFAPYYADKTFSEDLALRGFLSRYVRMTATSVSSWDELIIQMIILGRETNADKLIETLNRMKKNAPVLAAFNERWKAAFGESFTADTGKPIGHAVEMLKYNVITQKLSIAMTDDYRTLKAADAVTLQHMNRIYEQAVTNARTAEDFRKAMAELGAAVKEKKLIDCYGPEAPFNFISTGLCWPIIGKMVDSLQSEPEKCISKMQDVLIHFTGDAALEAVAHFVILVAEYYERKSAVGSLTLNSPEEYVQKYTTTYALLDRSYRDAIAALADIDASLSIYEQLCTAKERLNIDYDKFCNALTDEWMSCVTSSGRKISEWSLPLQQNFYATFVQPLAQKQVVIVSDALRYEVATEVVDLLAKRDLRFDAKIQPALAMLPTETKFCKPILLPHDDASLVIADNGADMNVDGHVLSGKALREKQLKAFSESGACFTFKELERIPKSMLREKFAGKSIIYVFHDEIDEIGHDGTAEQIARACHKAAEDLATFIASTLGSSNTYNLTLTADHGFLFNDKTYEEKDKLTVSEKAVEKSSRYYLTESADAVPGICKFPLNEVSAMHDSLMVAVPKGSARLAAPSGGYVFTHGGASLQEFVIPVVTFSYDRGDDARQPVPIYVLESGTMKMASSKVKFNLLQMYPVDSEHVKRDVLCALYEDEVIVSPVVKVTMDMTDPSLDRRKYPLELTLNKSVEKNVLQLRIYDKNDPLNALVKENVTNSTLIETDF